MDKITRTLLLYSRLINGEKVNKFAFCMETDCIPRTFDRDIEDVRLYLSETFDVRELRYDRQERAYYLSGVSRKELETVEYQLIERILLDTGVLRRDELEGLLQHVLSNTEQTMNRFNTQKELLNTYDGPMHKKALLKMHGDLALAIRNQLVIQIKYISDDETDEDINVLPCCLKYLNHYLYLTAFQKNNSDVIPTHFRLDKIHSFKVQRNQLRDEKQQVKNYLQLGLERNKKINEYETLKDKGEKKMAKKIRFPLEMENNVQVRTLEELQEHFSLEKVLFYISNEKLVTWLRDRYLDDIADKILELDERDATFNKKICEIFDVEYDEASEIDIELAAERNQKICLLKEFGYEKEYSDVIDQIAFEQEEIYDLLDENITTIYLCGVNFSIPLSKKGIRYIGIDNPVVVISSKEKVDLEEKEIVLEGVVFDEKYQEILSEHEKQEAKARNAFGDYVEDAFTKELMSKNDIEVAKATYYVLAQELEGFTYDVNDDTKNIMEYLLRTGIEEWGTDCLIDGGDTYEIRDYLSNSSLENWGIEYLENA